MSEQQINLRELREWVDSTSENVSPVDSVIVAAATVLALVEAVEAAALAIPISCCDQDICEMPPNGCAGGETCGWIAALEALDRFDFGDAT